MNNVRRKSGKKLKKRIDKSENLCFNVLNR